MRQLFAAAGWDLLSPRPALAGGQLWIAAKYFAGDEFHVKRSGPTLSSVAAALLDDAIRLFPPSPRFRDIQLWLPIAA